MKRYLSRRFNLKYLALLVLPLGTLLMPTGSVAQQKQNEVVALPQVKTLFASSSETAITLRWQLSHAENLHSIQLYRKDYPLPLRIQPPDFNKPNKIDRGLLIGELKEGTTSFSDDRVELGYYYYYRLVLRDNQLQETEPSAPAIATLKDTTPPDAPRLTSIKALDDQHFELQWQASLSPDVVAYRIYRSSGKGPQQIIRIINVRQAKQKTLREKLQHSGNTQFEYQIAIAAVDAAGNVSPPSAATTLRLPDKIAPRAPSLLQVTQQMASARLQWQASSENDIAGYRVYRRDNKPGSNFKALHEKLLSKPSFTDKTIQPLSTWYYRVAAVDRYGNESAATRGVLFRSNGFASAVSTPQKLMIARSKSGFPLLRWFGSGKGSAGFLLLRSDGGAFIPVSGLLQKTSFEDRSVKPQLAYKYRLVAVDTRGKRSQPSAIVLWRGGRQ